MAMRVNNFYPTTPAWRAATWAHNPNVTRMAPWSDTPSASSTLTTAIGRTQRSKKRGSALMMPVSVKLWGPATCHRRDEGTEQVRQDESRGITSAAARSPDRTAPSI